jgi:hypothetical protein
MFIINTFICFKFNVINLGKKKQLIYNRFKRNDRGRGLIFYLRYRKIGNFLM